MRFALACYGTRGDVEPSLAVGRELVDRGHEVRMAVPPDLVSFVEGAGLQAVPYGPPVEAFLDEEFLRNLWVRFFRNPVKLLHDLWAPIIQHWSQVGTTLKTLAEGTDLLSSAVNFEQAAANVAEYYDIPLIALHHFPMRPNGQLVPILPPALVRSGGTISEWLFWRSSRKVDNAQRRELGLPKARTSSPRRIADQGWIEIQAYDQVCVPGLASEWAKWGRRRPFVGALTMELPTQTDEEVASWIAAGPPPVCFATGSVPVESPTDTVAMISAACAELGQRALVCAGGTDFSNVAHAEHVKIVGPVNYATVFPACRAVVHHGGSGTTAASLRAGIPTLILWSTADQPYWGNQLRRLKVGASRGFSATTRETLIADLRDILDPQYAIRARDLAAQMIPPTTSIATAADIFETAARRKRC